MARVNGVVCACARTSVSFPSQCAVSHVDTRDPLSSSRRYAAVRPLRRRLLRRLHPRWWLLLLRSDSADPCAILPTRLRAATLAVSERRVQHARASRAGARSVQCLSHLCYVTGRLPMRPSAPSRVPRLTTQLPCSNLRHQRGRSGLRLALEWRCGGATIRSALLQHVRGGALWYGGWRVRRLRAWRGRTRCGG